MKRFSSFAASLRRFLQSAANRAPRFEATRGRKPLPFALPLGFPWRWETWGQNSRFEGSPLERWAPSA